MSKKSIVLVSSIIIVVLLIALFIWPSNFWIPNSTKKGTDNYVEEPASIKDVQVVILETFPVQVNVIVNGEFPDACVENLIVKTQKAGSTYNINIIRRLRADAICAEVITPFSKTIQLDVTGLKAGAYVVSVNGVTKTFELQSDNILKNTGYLEGEVEIGPLCPVEPCNLSQDQIEQAYMARKIVIYTLDKATTVSTISLDSSGKYRIALARGSYIVDINRIGIDSANLPDEVTIRTGEITELDIQIDTGIR